MAEDPFKLSATQNSTHCYNKCILYFCNCCTEVAQWVGASSLLPKGSGSIPSGANTRLRVWSWLGHIGKPQINVSLSHWYLSLSLPHLYPPHWFCPCVLYSSSCRPLSPLYPPHSPLAIVTLFLISMSVVIFCLLFPFVDYVPVKGEIIWYLGCILITIFRILLIYQGFF